MPDELILVVDDEPSILQLARLYLERDGFRVETIDHGEVVLQAVERLRPALIVLDIMLPGMDGLEICRRLRSDKDPVAIVMLTARDEDVDKIVGLELGADDYLTKPFNPRELVARVKAVLRRGERPAPAAKSRLRLGDMVIDAARREVTLDGRPVHLRNQEFDLLKTLVENQGIVLTRRQLLDQAWGYDYFGETRTVDVHVAQLRRKLQGSRVRIETVTGLGYKLVSE
jgi:two-component system alkaline phosphatase synthesis response regulator PhoP